MPIDRGYNDAMKSIDDASGPTANLEPSQAKPLLTTLLGRACGCVAPCAARGACFEIGFKCIRGAGIAVIASSAVPVTGWDRFYVNYGLTALIVTAGYFALFFSDLMSPNSILLLLTVFCFLFPLWFFRYARALWVAFDLYFDPARQDEFAVESAQDEAE